VYRVTFKYSQQIKGNHISRMDYHIDRVEQIFYQVKKKCPGFCGVGQVGI
jgi:hypothetical protein